MLTLVKVAKAKRNLNRMSLTNICLKIIRDDLKIKVYPMYRHRCERVLDETVATHYSKVLIDYIVVLIKENKLAELQGLLNTGYTERVVVIKDNNGESVGNFAAPSSALMRYLQFCEKHYLTTDVMLEKNICQLLIMRLSELICNNKQNFGYRDHFFIEHENNPALRTNACSVKLQIKKLCLNNQN